VNLHYSREDEAFRAAIRAWFEKEVPAHGAPPAADDWPARRAYDTAWQRKLHGAGLAGIAWPAEFGGRGLPISQQLVYLEEYARAEAPYIGVNFVGLMHAGPTLIAEGSDAQRRFHLPRILSGEDVWCQGFSEPQAGSDLASLRTRAVRDGDHYVVTGQKIWSTRAHVADWCELLVRTDADAPKHRGITWLVLDMHAPGVTVRPMRTLDGERHFCEVFLDQVRVPVANRVGEENDGWRVANVTLRFERGTAFAQHIIAMRSQVVRLAALARGAADLQPRIGRLYASVEALWRMTQMCVADAERTGLPSPLGSAVKLRYSELGQEIAELAVRTVGRPILGGMDLGGVATDEIARDYLWSLQMTIAAGTSQIQRNLIAQRILGMPWGASDAKRRAQ
jgi:alkylation response protein AidB-like acyl-CoA dehydrogenase